MRVAIVNSTDGRVGGVESYLAQLIPALRALGHEVGLFHESAGPADRARLEPRSDVPAWCAGELGADAAIGELRRWAPDVLYVHDVQDAGLEARLLGVAPAVIFAHAFRGTCVGGPKAVRVPHAMPCQREFGLACLAHYYPRRCGGLNPLTMIGEYGRQSRRLALMRRYAAVVTNSEFLAAEYRRHGLHAEPVHLPVSAAARAQTGAAGEEWRLLFAGRMIELKGGALAIDALGEVARRTGRRVRLTLAGDGPSRAAWERRAARVRRDRPNARVEFTGWVAPERVRELYASSDLLLVPSLWPEPFGLTGVEAGSHGLPAAGFAVGGIPEWLREGVSGSLAPADPPTALGLADAIVRSLDDPARHAELRRGAAEVARRFSMQAHLARLLEVLERVVAAAQSALPAPAGSAT